MTTRKLGWKPDLPDFRDKNYWATEPIALPSHVDLRTNMPAIYDQGELGDCVENAISAAMEFDIDLEKHPDFTPSRLFVYYNVRLANGDVDSDDGSSLRDGIKAVNVYGVCNESEWLYDVAKFSVKPDPQCYTNALLHKAVQYSAIQQAAYDMRHCLGSGYPFVAGISLFDSFLSDQVAESGTVPMPDGDKETLQGGHAICIVGYDDPSKVFIGRNSWGTSWGMKGYFTIPYQYMLNAGLAADFWTIKVVE